jgi:hypothetical protein
MIRRLLALLSMALKVICGPAQYLGHFRVIGLRSETAALLLHFG